MVVKKLQLIFSLALLVAASAVGGADDSQPPPKKSKPSSTGANDHAERDARAPICKQTLSRDACLTSLFATFGG